MAVLGAGQMGNGITQVAACAGIEVVMIDIKQEFVDRIHAVLGIEIPTIAKATKADLAKLADHLEAQQ